MLCLQVPKKLHTLVLLLRVADFQPFFSSHTHDVMQTRQHLASSPSLLCISPVPSRYKIYLIGLKPEQKRLYQQTQPSQQEDYD